METYARSLEALADPTRRSIFELVKEGPAAVGEIATSVPVSRPAVSQHLRVLEDAGLVSHQVVGTRHVYRVELGGLGELRAYVDGLWDASLARFKQAVEEER